jgi:hypothetical protein
MRAPFALVLFAAAATAAACATPVEDPGMAPRSAADAPARRATFAIQTRDYKVTFLTGDRVSVTDARGAVLADGVSATELERIDPFLAATVRNATASTFSTGAGDVYLDARLDRPAVKVDPHVHADLDVGER